MTDADPRPEPLADPRTAPDDGEDASALDDATDHGISSEAPAEGSDGDPGETRGSPEG